MKFSSDPDSLAEEHGNPIMGALWLAPKIAEGLGIYLATASHYEIMLHVLYRFVAGVGGEFIEATFGRIINISTRLDIIGDTLEARKQKIPADRFEKVNELLTDARKINRRRNELVHGTYRVYTKTRVVILSTWVFANAKSSKNEHLTAERLKSDALEVLMFSHEVARLVGIKSDHLESHLAFT